MVRRAEERRPRLKIRFRRPSRAPPAAGFGDAAHARTTVPAARSSTPARTHGPTVPLSHRIGLGGLMSGSRFGIGVGTGRGWWHNDLGVQVAASRSLGNDADSAQSDRLERVFAKHALPAARCGHRLRTAGAAVRQVAASMSGGRQRIGSRGGNWWLTAETSVGSPGLRWCGNSRLRELLASQ